jgi:peptidoglycan/xylan/chitin deacetylase (PgdA/CDA1 family)
MKGSDLKTLFTLPSLPLLVLALGAASECENPRQVTITIDDLPFVSANALTEEEILARTENLLGHLRGRAIPAIGFVNEGKLFEDEKEDLARVALLDLWIDAGMELGNHTYSHLDLHGTPLEEFQEDVLRGEVVTRRLMSARGGVARFFRHPFLHTGRDLRTKEAISSFLSSRGYRVAPVTIDNYDYLFARAYNLAEAGEKGRISEAYLRYMSAVVEFYEGQSRAILEYEPPQILLLHASSLNAENLGRVLDSLGEKGYRFVSLDEALRDPAFSRPDAYVGPAGITWLHRWAITGGLPKSTFAGEPEPGAFLPELR